MYRRSFLLLALGIVLCLSGARCNRTSSAPVATVVGSPRGSGPSSGITPIPGSGAAWTPTSHLEASFAAPLLPYINTHRQGRGLQPLIHHSGMSAVAKVHAEDMANRNYLAIVSPDGIDVYERMVSSVPRIDFADSFAFPMTTPGNSLQIFNALIQNPSSAAVINSPAVTHFGGWFLITPQRKGVVIFGQNVTP